MVRIASLFAQVLSLIDRPGFGRQVRRFDAERGAKGFACWDQLVAMLFAQLGGAHSLREVCGGLACALGKLRHLGVSSAPARSTLSYANAHRPWELYEAVFYQVLEQAQALAGRQARRFRFKNPLVSLDATVIDLCAEVFDWARFRRTKGAVKLHLQLDHQGCLPGWALVTEGKVHEVNPAKTLRFTPGTIVAVDRGYTDFGLFSAWCERGVWFVTRCKSNLDYRVIEARVVPMNRHILSDQIIELAGTRSHAACPHRLRRVVVWDEANSRSIELLSNHLTFGPTTLAAIYKDRWQIELFFKALKQNLHVKTFLGTSANAVRIQLWTALIAMLILKLLQLRSSFGWSLSNLAAMLRMNLLVYRDLWRWLDEPYTKPPDPPAQQLELFA
jgi:Transposase DDE domain/Domain of unknown function (DUF4372)